MRWSDCDIECWRDVFLSIPRVWANGKQHVRGTGRSKNGEDLLIETTELNELDDMIEHGTAGLWSIVHPLELISQWDSGTHEAAKLHWVSLG